MTSVFVPIVVVIAVLTAFVWLFFSIPHAITAAIAVLVIACPCALGLGTPIALMVGVGRAAQEQILIRNGEALQLASELTYVVFDKTGTITQGTPSVINCQYNTKNVAEINSYIHAVESRSEHPLALALVAFTINDKRECNVGQFNSVSARGISAKVDGKQLVIGNQQWMKDNDVILDPQSDLKIMEYARQAATGVLVAVDRKLVAIFAVADPIRQSSKLAIAELHQVGIKTAMISGDHPATANAIAQQAGIQTVMASAQPDDKASYITQLQAKGERVAMVGDGINDAPALTQANVGIAIGSGTDIAIESADVTLLSHSLCLVGRTIKLSQATMRTIKRTLFGAFIYNSFGVLIATGVFYPWWHLLLSPIIASVAMAASSLTVVMVASRLKVLIVK